MSRMTRMMVSLLDKAVNAVRNELKGKLRKGDLEVIRQIVISYLTEKDCLVTPRVKEMDKLRETVKIMSDVVKAMVELLIAKGMITREEFGKALKERLPNELKRGTLDDRRIIAEFKRLKEGRKRSTSRRGC